MWNVCLLNAIHSDNRHWFTTYNLQLTCAVHWHSDSLRGWDDNYFWVCGISGFCCQVDEIWALKEYYIALSGSSIPTFRDKLSVPSSRVKRMGPIACTETSVQNYHSTLRNIPQQIRYHRLLRTFCKHGNFFQKKNCYFLRHSCTFKSHKNTCLVLNT
jgi:hypothetical protein